MVNKNKVRVYRNLNKKCLSVQSWVEGKGWRVTDHVQEIALDGVSFKVSQAGRERCLREKRKNVHAYMIGTRVDKPRVEPTEAVKYNPYVADKFFYTDSPNRFPVRCFSAVATTKGIKATSISR